jgi:serine/threonine-protein kinase RsbW
MNRNGAAKSQETIELRIAARSENLVLARLALAGVAANAGAPEEIVADLKVAVTEACTNAIQHAYPDPGAGHEIVVRYKLGVGALSIEVEDSGSGFTPDKPPSSRPDDGTNLGLGLRIIRELADALTVSSGSWGSRIIFVKRFSPEGRDPSPRGAPAL